MTDPTERLRAMLLERATDVQQVPAHLADLQAPPARFGGRRRPPRPTQLLVAASAVAVLVVSITTGIVATRSHPNAPRPAASHHPRPTSHGTTPSPATPAVCGHVDRTDWGHAITAGFHNPYPHSNTVVAVAPDGTAYDYRIGAQDVVQVRFDGTEKPVLGPLTGLAGGVTGAGVDDQYLAVGALTLSGVGRQLNSVYLVQPTTGKVREIRAAAEHDTTVVLGPTVLDGHVYWTEIGGAATSGQVRDYDVGTGSIRTIGTHAATAPMVSGGGLYWSTKAGLVTYRRGALPHGFTPQPGKTYGNFVTDGSSSAWLRYTGAVPQVVLQRGDGAPRILASGTELAGTVDALSGPLVFWHRGTTQDQESRLTEYVFDMRSNVVASNFLVDWVTAPPVAAHGVLTLPSANGGLSVVRTAVLPPLRC